MERIASILLLAFACAASFGAHTATADSKLDAAHRREVIRGIAELVEQRYVDADKGREIAAGLRADADSDAYADLNDQADVSSALTHALQKYDRHFRVYYSERPFRGDHSVEQRAAWDAYSRTINFGFQRTENLLGNVGYLDIRYFDRLEHAAGAANSALNLISNADAIIIDLRRNGGGEPEMVQLFMSYFLGPDSIHYNSMYWRASNETVQYRTFPHVLGKRMLETPLYILTSGQTGSAAEEFAYNLQAQARATIVGDVTAGGANPGETYEAPRGFRVFISNGKAINPVTGTNWEKVGVQPDIEIPSNEAFDWAYAESLRKIIDREGAENASRALTWALEALEVKASPVNLLPSQTSEFAGTYQNRTIRNEDGRLTYQRANRTVYEMVYLGEDRFLTLGKDGFRLQFRRDDHGQIIGLLDMWSGGHTEWNLRD